MWLIGGLVFVVLLHGSSSQKDAPEADGGYKQSCGNRTYSIDPDRVCCTYQDDEVYIPTKLCDGSSTEDPRETCGPEGPRFDFRFQGCCNGRLVFDKPRFKCCAGSANGVNSAIPLDTPCCNGAALQQDQLCCESTWLDGGKAFPKNNPRDNACCVYLGQDNRVTVSTYSSRTAMCLRGEVTAKPAPPALFSIPLDPPVQPGLQPSPGGQSASGSVMTWSASLHIVSVITLLVCS